MNMLLDNDVVAKVLKQLVASGLHYVLVRTFGATSEIFSRYLTSSIEIHIPYGSKSNVGSWLQEFIEHKIGEKLSHFRITNDLCSSQVRDRGLRSGLGAYWFTGEEVKADGENTSLGINKQAEPLPTNRSVFFWYRGTCIRVVRKPNSSYRTSTGAIEVFMITAYGTSNKKLLFEMIDEARRMAEDKPEKHVNYYRTQTDMGRWRLMRRIQPRSLSSVVLAEGVTKQIQDDVEDFLNHRQWYRQRGIPYRRGYLLFGPPGCGKTSFVKAIAGQIGYDIYEMQLSDRQLTDQQLRGFMSTFGSKSILLIEDVDAAFVARIQDEERVEENDVKLGKLKIREAKSGVTFSGLLNAIDGVASEEDYIVFMTTNHIEKLDPALIRPGRIDLKQLIDYPDKKQIEAFFQQFYPDCSEELPPKFAKAVKDLKCSPTIAEIQGVFLKHKNDPEDNLKNLSSLIKVLKDNPNHRNLYI